MARYIAYNRYRRKWEVVAIIDSKLKLHDVGNECMSMLGHGDLDCWDVETRYAIGWDCSFDGTSDRFLIVSRKPLISAKLDELANQVEYRDE